jgi:hypothetical protein
MTRLPHDARGARAREIAEQSTFTESGTIMPAAN